MEKLTSRSRLEQMPILHVRGTHAAVGFAIGKQFKSMVHDVLSTGEYFNTLFLPAYETVEGKQVYESSLEICTRNFPQYVEELQGIAVGADVPFYKLFLLNLEFFLPIRENVEESRCSSILCNSKELIMAHNEDTGPELLNNCFIVSAEIIGDDGQKLEKFTSFSYAGCLPGYTSGFNEHGFIHCINTLNPCDTRHGRTPRNFLARAILSASNLDQVLNILKDEGAGASDGFSVNMYFAKEEGASMMYNVEVGPNPDGDESKIDLFKIPTGGSYAHCNKYLHLDVPELPIATMRSSRRHQAIERHPKPENMKIVREILSDRSDPELPVFRYGETDTDKGNTVATGIFDITNRKWNIYIQPSNKGKPIVVIPMDY